MQSINGTLQGGIYREALPCGGKLWVVKDNWGIEYYFPGPDRRYNGTFLDIRCKKVEIFAKALEQNARRYEELDKSLPPGSELTIVGEEDMIIRWGDTPFKGVSIRSHHILARSVADAQRVATNWTNLEQRVIELRSVLFRAALPPT